ncbi:MAG: radical SAM protein [Bradymonadales bacterium]|nr:radical SAM protein [Bradymonadales bacterium]
MTAFDDIHPVDYLVETAIREIIPLGVHLDLTYRCDLACVHCYLKDRGRQELTLPEIERLLAELAELGTLFVVFSGGDPFVRPDLLDILQAAAHHRFCIRLITHGQAISDAMADELADLGLNRAYISVYHTDPRIHDRITGRVGSHARTLDGIRRLLARGIPVIIKCPVFKENADAARCMPGLVRSLRAELELSITIRAGNDRSTDLLELNLEQLDAVRTACASLEICGLGNEPGGSQWGERVCLAAHTSAYIGPDGTVQPCLDYEVSCGNIRQATFRDIWFGSPLLNELRALRRTDFKACLECPDLPWCRLCPAHAFHESGSPSGVATSSCREAAILRLAMAERKQRKATRGDP